MNITLPNLLVGSGAAILIPYMNVYHLAVVLPDDHSSVESDMITNLEETTFIRDLGDGLVLRRSTVEDADALSEFNSRIHSDDGPDKPDEKVAAWTRDLLEKPHPTFQAGDFTIVEDTKTGKIVSSMNLISQTWEYAGIPFKVGRPELVGTHPDHRNRGLVRAQFKVVHQWSAKRGEKVQGITGIPYYYRLFGYEMALNLEGGRSGFTPHVPKLAEGHAEPYRVRPADEGDLGLFAELYRQFCQRQLVSCVWDEALWRYELNGKSRKNVNRSELRVIEISSGEAVGCLAHPWMAWGSTMAATFYELKPGVSYAEATPSVIRYLMAYGKDYLDKCESKEELGAFGFWLGAEHPVYQVAADRLPHLRRPYAWYLRVVDLPDFLRHIRPVLERRLAASPLSGHSGDLRLTFYNSGLKLVIEKGQLAVVEAWHPEPVGHAGEAAFPGLTFLQLLFGYRNLEELKYAFPDCWTKRDDAAVLLSVLFPKLSSNVCPVS